VQAKPYILSWALDSDVPFFALLGDFGTGKTFTCRMLAREISARHHDSPESVPLCIYIDLRRVQTRVGSEKKVPRLVDVLRDAIEFSKDPLDKSIVTPEDVILRVRSNEAMIIFDGLDEKTVHFSPEETNQFIAGLWSVREQRSEKENPPPQGKILISCRTHYFRDTIEQNTLFLGRDREGRAREEYRACTLLPFDSAQIREYLEKRLGCDKEKIDRIVELFEKVHNLKDLASRPYTLNLVTESIPDIERKIEEGIHVNTATLYDTTVDNWLARDEGKHEFSTPHKKRLMKSLAAELHKRGGEGLETDELDEWLDEWLYRNPVIKDAYASLNRETLKKDLRTATFIIREEADSFSFAHTSLQEYFLAGFIVDALSARQFEPLELEMKMPSKETIDFVADMLAADARKSGPVIERLASILETAYHNDVSELAFALWLKLHEHGMRTPAPRTVHLEQANLAGWVIGNLNLSGARFEGANLRGTSFRNTVLASASFRRANLVNAEFLACNATGADFSEADAVAGIWRTTDLRKSRWTSSELRLASFVECQTIEMVDFPEEAGFVVARCEGLNSSAFGKDNHISYYDGHFQGITSAAFSHNDSRIISTSFDKSFKLWDVLSGKCLMTLSGHSQTVTCAAFSHDDSRIISASNDTTLKLWDIKSGTCLMTLSGHSSVINAVSFSPDGQQIISASDDNTLKLWNAQTGKCLLTLCGHSGWVRVAAFSPDGQRIISGSYDATLKLWDAQSGKCLMTLSGHSGAIMAVAFSYDGNHVIAATDNCIIMIWNVLSGQCVHSLAGHSSLVNNAVFSPSGQHIISASDDKIIKIWDAWSGQCLQTLTSHSGWRNDCLFSYDESNFISNFINRYNILCYILSGQYLLQSISGLFGNINTVGFNPSGNRIISASQEQYLKLWDAQSGRCLKILCEDLGGFNTASFNSDGTRIICGSILCELKLLDAHTGQCLRVMRHSGSILAAAFSPNGNRIISASADQTIKLWDTQSGKCLMTINGQSGFIKSAAFSPDGQRIISTSENRPIRIWDANSGECLMTLSGHSTGFLASSFSPDGSRVISDSHDNNIKIWDAVSGNCLLNLTGHSDRVRVAAFSPHGQHIISASDDNTLKLWDAQTGQCLITLSGHLHWVRAAAFSPDGQRIISGSFDNTIKIWDAQTGQCLMTMANLPDNETASWSETELKLLSASPNAWRWIGIADGCRRLPIELLAGSAEPQLRT
jgi:WD40 repeat protein